MIKADFHVHTEFSNDSDTCIENQIERAIDLGFKFICITDHCDMDCPNPEEKSKYILDTELYIQKLKFLKERYTGKINVLCGVELGLIPYLKEQIENYTKTYNFDFIIGSSHLVGGKDPGIGDYFEGRTEKEAYKEYFESILENVKTFDNYNVYGHLDYVIRYGPNKSKCFDIKDYEEILEQILKIIIKSGKGIEINTAGLRKNLGYFHPHRDILKMYRDLGGEIITIGSDAHCPSHVGYKFDIVPGLLKSMEFKYYAIFENRNPRFYDL